MSIKIEDVARQAGVSSATVSRVLSGKPYVSTALRARVTATVELLGYRPSRVARTLRVQRASTLGIVVSDIQNPFFTAVVRAAEDAAHRNQLSVLLCNTDEDVEKETLYIDLMLAEHVAGVILSPTTTVSDACLRLVAAGVPVVAIDRRVANAAIDAVVVDNVSAAFELVSHLLDMGHSRIGALIGAPLASTGEERLRGYARALRVHGIPYAPELVRSGQPKTDLGQDLTLQLLALAEPPTAIFTGNNLLTIGALRAIHEVGLRIPEEMALAAFDEMDWMFFVKPALTVVAQPTADIGRKAVELLLERMADPERPRQEVVLPATLYIRESSAGWLNRTAEAPGTSICSPPISPV